MTERLEAIEASLRELQHQAELMKTVLLVKEPDSVLAAGAFDGLRKQLVAVAQEHWAHLAQLATMDVAINHVDDVAELRLVSEEWLAQAGVRKVTRTDGERLTEVFELVGDGPEPVGVLQPAYVDEATGRVIKAGRLMTGSSEAAAEGAGDDHAEEETP